MRRTLGDRPNQRFTPKALHKALCNAFGVNSFLRALTQGAVAAPTDPGLCCGTPLAFGIGRHIRTTLLHHRVILASQGHRR